MPADPSHNPLVRRAIRKQTVEEEIDSRRARGEISCAECRRLKLKCDKKLPCSSCIRRGCPSICPNGSLSTGQGTRFVLADTTQLHAKITEMGQRIRQLEDALAIFQSGVSNEVHPLLRDELLSVKFGPEKGYVPDKATSERNEAFEAPIEALGTMTIGDHGESKYFGPSAGSEALFLAGADFSNDNEDADTNPVALEIAQLSASFPFGTARDFKERCDIIFEHLPDEPRAWSLCETYMEQASWAFRPIKREELIEEILSPVYRAVKERRSTGSYDYQHVTPHKFAVLFAVFALGALVDLTLVPLNPEADVYYHLSRSCLALHSVFDSPEIPTVQAILLISNYLAAGKQSSTDGSWSLMEMGAKLGQSLGLHRDSSRWQMDSKTTKRRRALFWEMFSGELFFSLALGRPPSIRLSYIDCEFPEDEEATINEQGETMIGYYQWKYEFTKEIFAHVIEQTLTAEVPKYQTVLELDRKVREKRLPPHLNAFINTEDQGCTPSAYMRGCLLGQYRSVTLLYIHRSFFAQALLDYPENPLKSPFSPSFLAAYRCASGVIKSTLNHYDRFPQLCGSFCIGLNLPNPIVQCFLQLQIIVGSIVTRSPSSSMASSAFIELGLACDLFEKGAIRSRRARSALGILFRMREKAFQVFSNIRTGQPLAHGPLSVGIPDYGDDELALFGGQTKVLVSKLLSGKKQKKRQSSSTSPSIASPASSEGDARSTSSNDLSQEVHPSLVEYLSMFPPSSSSDATSHRFIPSMSSPSSQPTTAQLDWSNWSTLSLSTPLPNEPFAFGSSPSTFTGPSNPMGKELLTDVGVDLKTDPGNSLNDLGMMMTGDSGMDEHWMSFMRGLLQVDGNASGVHEIPSFEMTGGGLGY